MNISPSLPPLSLSLSSSHLQFDAYKNISFEVHFWRVSLVKRISQPLPKIASPACNCSVFCTY
jgi:hypothetical protein